MFMAGENNSTVSRPARKPGCIAWLALTLIAVILIAGILLWKGVDATFGSVRSLFGFLGALPAKFQSQNITHTFREELISVTPTKGDILEVATLEMTETLTSYDMKSAFGDLLYLGTTVSEIKVPTVYRYHIKISDEWKLSVSGNVCTVLAPEIRPSLPPAIRTEGMEKKSEAGWLRFNADKNLEKLEKGLTPTLEMRAGMPRRIDQVREGSRKAVAEFVRQWLIKEQQWSKEAISAIVVRFPDEPETQSQLPSVAVP